MDDMKFKSDMEFITWIFCLGQSQKMIIKCAQDLEDHINSSDHEDAANLLQSIYDRLCFIAKNMEP